MLKCQGQDCFSSIKRPNLALLQRILLSVKASGLSKRSSFTVLKRFCQLLTRLLPLGRVLPQDFFKLEKCALKFWPLKFLACKAPSLSALIVDAFRTHFKVHPNSGKAIALITACHSSFILLQQPSSELAKNKSLFIRLPDAFI